MRKVGVKKIVDKNNAVLNDGTKVISPKIDLIDDYYTSIYNQLSGNKLSKTGKTVLGGFVGAGLTALKKSLDDPEKVVNSLKFLGSTLQDAQSYLDKNESENVDFSTYLIQQHLFGWQKEFFETSAKKITQLAGRRAGKSYGMAAKAVGHCLVGFDDIVKDGIVTKKPRKVLIMGLTLGKAKEVFWNNLIYFIEISKIKVDKIDNSTYSVVFSNGSTINLTGNASTTEREKLRGGEYSMIIIDESQSQVSLKYLMKTILGPIISGRDSTVILAGTGSLRASDYWQSITDGEESANFKHFTATMLDNPTINVSNWDKILEENGWTMDSPAFRREYLGENIQDLTRLMYPLYHFNSDLESKPVIVKAWGGIDYGFNDDNAVIVVGEDSIGKYHTLYESVFNHADLDKIKEEALKGIKAAREAGVIGDIKFFADTSDQTISSTLYKSGIKVYNTFKFEIRQRISMVNSVLRNGDLTIEKGKALQHDFENDLWQYSMEEDQIIYEEDPVYHANAAVALGYVMSYVLYKKLGKTEWAKNDEILDPRG